MQEIEHRDRNGRPRLSQSNFRVPSSRSAYGSTPGWVEKATKDFLDDAGDTEPSFGIKQLPYTRPQLRETIKRRIMAGSNGGRPGQWSARKAQLVAQAYRRAGGGYRGKPGRTQRSLKKWTSERWTTSDGKPARRKGRMTRYLPAAAWKRLTPAQRRATIAKKLAGDKAGKQFVANTQRAATASKKTRSKTLGPSVDEVAKNPNAPKVFSDTSSEKDRIVSTEPLEQAFSPNKEKLNEITNAPSYGENPPVKPFVHGNIDIDNREPIEKQNGDFSLIEPTIIDGSGDELGMFVIVPLITKFGQLIEVANASSYFSKTDEHLGKFKSREDAEKYLEWLKDIEEEISYRDKKKPIISMHPIEKIAESAGDGFESRRMSIKNTIKRITDKYMTEKALGPTLRAVNSVQIYDPDAIDADGDGLVQDATPWMRPALPSSPIIAGLRSASKSSIASQRAVKEAQEFVKFISQHEPELTQMMKDLADKKGSSLYLRGLKNRQKTVESLALKAQRLQHLFDGDLTDSITSMNDPLRYTFESDDVNKYTNDVLEVISALAKKGHKAVVTNYWTSGDPYKGINVMVDHPDGFFYEIQFHTPSSYRLKNKLTPLYEKYRDEKDVKKRQEIYDEMLKLSKGVSIPKEIGKFGEPLSRGSGQADFKPARPGKLIPTPLGLSSRRTRPGPSSQQSQRSDVPLRLPVPDDWFIGDTQRSQVERNFPDFHLRWDEGQGLYVPATGHLKENAGGYDRLADTELAGAYLTRKYWHPSIASSDSRVASIMNKWRSDFSDSRAITRALAGLDVPNNFDSPSFRKDVQVLGEALSTSTPLGISTYRVARLTPDVGRTAEIGDELNFAAAAVVFSPNDAQGFELDELSMANAPSKFMFEFPSNTRGLIFDDGGEKAAKRPFAEGGDKSPKEAIVAGKFRVVRIEKREVRDPNKRQGVMRDVYVLESMDDTRASTSGMSSRRIEADRPLPLSEISPDLSDKFPATNTRSGGITTIAKIPEYKERRIERLSEALRRSYDKIIRNNYSTAATKDILKDVLRDDLTKLQDGTFLRMPARESLKDDRKRLLNSLRIIFDTRKGTEAVNLPTMHAEPYEPFKSMVDQKIDWSSIYIPTDQDAQELLREIATLKIGDEPSESERASINDEWQFIKLSTHDKFKRSTPDNTKFRGFEFVEDETFISIYEAGMRNAFLFLGGEHDGMHLAVGRGFDRHGEYAALLAEISFILQIPELSDKMRNIVASEKLREILGVPFGEAVKEIIPDIKNSVYDMPKVFDALIRRSTYKDVGGMSSRNSTRSIRSASEADIDAISQEYLGSERFSRRLSEVHGIESQIGMRSIRERIPMKEVLQSSQELDDENNDSKFIQNQIWSNLNRELEKRLLTMDGWTDDQKKRIKEQVDNLLSNLRAMRDDWQSMGRRERSGILRRERLIDGFESHPEIDMNIDDIIKQAELRIHDDGTLSFKLPPNPILRELIPGDRNYQDVEIPDRETIQSIIYNIKTNASQWDKLFESIYRRVGGSAQLAGFPTNGEELPHHSLYLPSYKRSLNTKFPGLSDAIKYRYNDIAARILQHYVGPELAKVKRNENPKIGKVANDNDHYIHGYLGLMADPHAWREIGQELDKRFEVPPSVILHDVLGHYANGNTFDRHGEWGNILATIALARDKEFWEKLRQIPELADLTDEDREIFIRGLLADVAAAWIYRVGFPESISYSSDYIKERINYYDGPIDELLDQLDPPSTQSQGGMSSTRRTPLTNVTDRQLVNLGLQSVDGAAIRGMVLKPSGMSSRRRDMTDSEKERLRPITLAPDEKVKLQPGTTLVYTDEDDRIIRTELIGPQVARVRGMAGMKLYTDPNPDNQDAVDAQMREWEELYGPVSSPQRQAKGRGGQPDRTEREQGRPRATNEDPIDRILRETEEARGRRGLSSRTDTAVPVALSKNGDSLKIKYGDFELDIRDPEATDNKWAKAYEKLLSWEGSYYSRMISSALLGLEPPMAHGGKGPKAKFAEAASTGSSKGLGNFDIIDFRAAIYNAFVSIERVRNSSPTVRPLYRGMVVDNDSSIVDSNVGDTFSMPLTSFTYVELGAKEFAGGSFNSPESSEGTPILIVLEKGAKAADCPNGTDMFRDGYLDSIDDGDGGLVRVPMESVTQGKFKIVGKEKTMLPAGEGWEIRIQQLDTYVPAGSGMSSRTNPPVPGWAKEADISRPIGGMSSRTDTYAILDGRDFEEILDELELNETEKDIARQALLQIYENENNSTFATRQKAIDEIKNLLSDNPTTPIDEKTKKAIESISIKISSNGIPVIFAQPHPTISSILPNRDWSEIEAPSAEYLKSILPKLKYKIKSPKNTSYKNQFRIGRNAPISIETNELHRKFDEQFRNIIKKIQGHDSEDNYKEYKSLDGSWVQQYVSLVMNPARGSAIPDVEHDILGHFGTGRGFDRHGEWANALAITSFILDSNLFDLTEEERDAMAFWWLGQYGIPQIFKQLNQESGSEEGFDVGELLAKISHGEFDHAFDGSTRELIALLDAENTSREGVRSASTRSIRLTEASPGLLLQAEKEASKDRSEFVLKSTLGNLSSRPDKNEIISGMSSRNRLTDEQRQQMLEMLTDGMGNSEIMKKLGVTMGVVRQFRIKNNIPPTGNNRLTDEQIQQIFEMLAYGMSDIQIAEKLGVTRGAIRNHRINNNIPSNLKAGQAATGKWGKAGMPASVVARNKKIIALHKLGKLDTEIARELGIGKTTVREIRVEAGLTRNTYRKWNTPGELGQGRSKNK